LNRFRALLQHQARAIPLDEDKSEPEAGPGAFILSWTGGSEIVLLDELPWKSIGGWKAIPLDEEPDRSRSARLPRRSQRYVSFI
jgi:hypothetical protein